MRLRLRARIGRLQRRERVLGAVGTAIAISALLLATLSNFFYADLASPIMSISLRRGGMEVSWGTRPVRKWRAYFGVPEWPEWPDPWTWRPYHADWVPWHDYVFPLWLPILLGLALATPAIFRMSRTRLGEVCPFCGYNMTGLRKGTPCPECGHRPKCRTTQSRYL